MEVATNHPTSNHNVAREAGLVRKTFDTFGFIADSNGTDRFFHWSNISKQSARPFHHLRVGDRVTYIPTTTSSEKGPRPTADEILFLPSSKKKD